jgi:hypothetical protein
MKSYFYYYVLRKTIIQFLDAFNDIKIARYNPDTGALVKYVEVPLKLWAKEKAWYWINEQAKMEEALPIISAEMISIVYDSQRQTNPLQYITNTDTTTTSGASAAAFAGQVSRFLNPVPYNISFSLRIWSLYMVDIDQILEQILPYFAPAIQLKIKLSDLDVTFDAKVVFEAATPEIESEYADEERRVIKWNLDFVVQTYMFKPVETNKITKSIFINEYTDATPWAARSTTSTYSSGASAQESKRILGLSPYYDSDGEKLYTYELFGSG